MIEQHLDEIFFLLCGAIGSYAVREFWDYITKKNCTECKMIESMKKELTIMKQILIEVAEKSGVDVESYRELIK